MSEQSIRQQFEALEAMRAGGVKTCPASRHAFIVAEMMIEKDGALYQSIKKSSHDPEHMSGSLLSVIQSLWEGRAYLEWDREAKRWVPIEQGKHLEGDEG